MVDSFLAQKFDADNWIQIIILVLVFGGSILSAIAKKLIEKFRPKEEELKGRGQLPTDPLQPTPPKPPVSRDPVFADTITPPRPTVPKARPVAPPPARPPERRAVEWEIEELTEAQPEQTSTRDSDVQPPQAPRKRRGSSKRAPDLVKENLAHPAPSGGKRIRNLHSHLEHDGEDLDAAVDARLGHLESQLEVQEAEPDSPSPSSRFPRPTLGTLRDAIILSEILSPPLALRDPDEGI